jgi:hypothetical protein
MSTKPRLRRRGSRGQGLVEIALVAPILLLLILGIFEAGRFVLYYHSLNHAAREGARLAIVRGENAFSGCPSGPVAPTSPYSDCDPLANNIRDRVVSSGFGLDATGGLTFGGPGEEPFLKYTFPDGSEDNCRNNPPVTEGCNRRNNNVTVRLQYTYPPLLDIGFIPSVTIRAEATLVVNN